MYISGADQASNALVGMDYKCFQILRVSRTHFSPYEGVIKTDKTFFSLLIKSLIMNTQHTISKSINNSLLESCILAILVI